MEVLTQITVDDIVRAGNCRRGVREIADEYFPGLTVVSVEAALQLLPDEHQRSVVAAAGLVGDGAGYGAGDGDGDGVGAGYGDGVGAGDGYGYGYGDVAGYGAGDGDVDGYG